MRARGSAAGRRPPPARLPPPSPFILPLAAAAGRLSLTRSPLSAAPPLPRSYLIAAAVAGHLSGSERRSAAAGTVALGLPGQLACLEPADWLHHLCGGLNFRDLVSKVALLPQARRDARARGARSLAFCRRPRLRSLHPPRPPPGPHARSSRRCSPPLPAALPPHLYRRPQSPPPRR